MALIAEYALTPCVFDVEAYSSAEVCDLHLQRLKEVLLQEGLVRNLRAGEWAKTFGSQSRSWHPRGKELLKKLRMVDAAPFAAATPQTDADWCVEALASHAAGPLAGVIATDDTALPHARGGIVSSVSKLSSAQWWAGRSPSLLLKRSRVDYENALTLVWQHANSLMFVDPYIDPSDHQQFGDLMALIEGLSTRSPKPRVEIHRVAWYGDPQDRRPKPREVEQAMRPAISKAAKVAGLSVEVFLWEHFHDRYLITDLIGICLPHGFGTTTAPDSETTWHRLSRDHRDFIQRKFDSNFRAPLHRFAVS